jgi:hypothetical protein
MLLELRVPPFVSIRVHSWLKESSIGGSGQVASSLASPGQLSAMVFELRVARSCIFASTRG